MNINIKCDYDLKKDGSMKNRTILNDYKKILCIIKDNILFEDITIPLDKIYGRNENEILYNLLIFKYAQKKDLKYLKYKKVIYIFYEKNMSNLFLQLYWYNSLYNNKEFAYFYGYKKINLKKLLSSVYFDYKLRYINQYDNQIFIRIFYDTYVGFMLKNLKKSFNDFPNYHELYLYLKKKNLVKKYYTYYVPIMKHSFNKFYKRILKDPLNFELYKRDESKKIKSFCDIDINKIIKNLDKHRIKQTINKQIINKQTSEKIPKKKIYSIKKTFTKLIKQLNLE